MAPTMVTSSPSRIHTVPRPTTTSQWNFDQGRRSIRAGMVVRIVFSDAGLCFEEMCELTRRTLGVLCVARQSLDKTRTPGLNAQLA